MPQTPDSDTTTQGIRIQAAAQYLPDRSDPENDRHLYVYRIRIVNEGDERVKLLSRHWIILDAYNARDVVKGEGVVGKQPDLAPGELFEYRSYCPLNTPWGTMEGSYTFMRPDDSTFEAEIGRFFLVPDAGRSLAGKS